MRRLPLLLLCWLCLPLQAQQALEIIPLRHRTVEQVLPALRPLLEPGAALSGMNNQLFLRASPGNREEIRQALAAIDTPPRRLLVQVSQDRASDARQRGVEASGRIALGDDARFVQPPGGSPGNTRIEIRRGGSTLALGADERRETRSTQTAQSVQVVEGGRAFLRVGVSLPLPLRQVVVGRNGVVVTESVVHYDIGQGFHAEPRVAGERVTVDISPAFDQPGPAGSVQTQRLTTTVSGRLGEWIELGGSAQAERTGARAAFAAGEAERQDRRGVWLRVDLLP